MRHSATVTSRARPAVRLASPRRPYFVGSDLCFLDGGVAAEAGRDLRHNYNPLITRHSPWRTERPLPLPPTWAPFGRWEPHASLAQGVTDGDPAPHGRAVELPLTSHATQLALEAP